MKILVIAPYYPNCAPGQRYRIEQWLPYLKKHDKVEFDFLTFCDENLQRILYSKTKLLKKAYLALKNYIRLLLNIIRIKNYDAIFIFREVSLFGPPILEYIIKSKKIPIIYDFDDAVYLPYISPIHGWLSYFKCPWKTRYICKISSHVTVGNDTLFKYAIRYNKNVTIIPSTIDTDSYFLKEHNNKKKPVIGWTGSFSTMLKELPLIDEALSELKNAHDFNLVIISDRKPKLKTKYKFIEWNHNTETRDLSVIDVGIMPLQNDAWNRGKCGFKILQYMGMGIPVVASPVGVNSDIIRHAENGFLAKDKKEWIEKLEILIKDAGLRNSLGKKGRGLVENRYSKKVGAEKLREVFNVVIKKSTKHV